MVHNLILVSFYFVYGVLLLWWVGDPAGGLELTKSGLGLSPRRTHWLTGIIGGARLAIRCKLFKVNAFVSLCNLLMYQLSLKFRYFKSTHYNQYTLKRNDALLCFLYKPQFWCFFHPYWTGKITDKVKHISTRSLLSEFFPIVESFIRTLLMKWKFFDLVKLYLGI